MQMNSLSQFNGGLSGEGPPDPLLIVCGNVFSLLIAHEVEREFHRRKIQSLKEPVIKVKEHHSYTHFQSLQAFKNSKLSLQSTLKYLIPRILV